MSSHFANSESTTHPCPRDEAGQISCPTWASQAAADILIDGTLSYMFGSRVSERYFEHLLKGRIRKSLLRWDLPGWPGACFICEAQAPELETPPIHHEHRQQPALQARLLDYDVRSLGGTVVPQALWSPHGKNATKKYVLDATLQWPVFFIREDRTVGIPLQEAVEGQCPALLGAKTHAPLGGRCTLHVRIKWPGYGVWTRQRQARDDTHRRNPITLAKFAQQVGRCVGELLRDCEGRPTHDPKWRIGRGGILPSEVLVLGVVHVSSGTWQPILALTKVVM